MEITTKSEFTIPSLLQNLTSVVAVIINDGGIVRENNAGFLFITGEQATPSQWDVRSLLVQPSFNELKQILPTANGEPVYQGLLNIGDITKQCRTIQGAVYRFNDELLIVGEHSISDLEQLSASIVELNEELSATQRALVKTNNQLKRNEKKLTQLMQTDPLTDIANRRHFEAICQQEITRAKRYNQPLCLAMADIDKFKSINDTYGHSVGDCVIQSFANLMKTESRESDLPARIGGEEFALLMPQTQIGDALNMIERLRQTFSTTEHCDCEQTVTASFGLIQFQSQDTLSEMLRRVDKALYQAKSNGRNQTICD